MFRFPILSRVSEIALPRRSGVAVPTIESAAPRTNGAAPTIEPGAPRANGVATALPAVPIAPSVALETRSREPAALPQTGWQRTFSSLRHRDFALMTASALPHMLSIQMGMIASGYLAYQLTNSATTLGLMGLAWGVPMLTLSLVGGVVADRVPRRTILIVTQSAIGLAALTNAVLVLSGQIQIWHLFITALVQGTAFSFNMPARQAMVADVVGREDLANALALTNANMNMTRVLGPAVAGFLIAMPSIGIGGIYLLMAGLYVIVVATMFQIQGGRTRASVGGGSPLEKLLEGIRYIAGNPSLVRLLLVGMIPMLLGMHYQTLMPVFAIGILGSGAEGLGLLNMAVGIGALIGSMALAANSGGRNRERVQMFLGIGFGLSLLLFGIGNSFAVALIALPLVGATSAAYQSLNNTLIMQHTPREFYGRVMSVYMMGMAMMPLASAPAARLADEIGARPTVAASGALIAYVIAIIAFGSGLKMPRFSWGR
ncbi:MAG: MFS transporter [Chloroflexota bacterium]|nr:MAG: MFS transporter [Chloroflexota bacterium]